MAREIGMNQTSKHQCAFCEEPYDSSAFRNYMLKGRSQKIKCGRCDNASYFAMPDNLSKADQFRLFRALIYIYLLPFLLALFLNLKLIKFNFIERGLGLLWLFLILAALIAIYLGSLYKKLHKWKFFEVKKAKPKEDAIKRECAFCQESLDSPEFWNYMLQPSSEKIKCISCENTSYFARPDKLSKASQIAFYVLFFICLLPFPLALALINKYRIFNGLESWLFLSYAALIAVGLAILSVKFYKWNFSAVTKTKRT